MSPKALARGAGPSSGRFISVALFAAHRGMVPAMAKGENSTLRWFRIICRTIHIATLAVVVGGVMFGASAEQLGIWTGGVVLTGMALMTTDLLGSDPYLRLVHGGAMVVKLVMLGLAVWLVSLRLPLLFAVIVLSGVVSHMSGKYRHYPLWGEPMDGH